MKGTGKGRRGRPREVRTCTGHPAWQNPIKEPLIREVVLVIVVALCSISVGFLYLNRERGQTPLCR